MKKIIAIGLTVVLLSGCATTKVSSVSQVLSEERVKQKNCYKWSITSTDTAKMAVPMAILPLAIIFPPLFFVVWISYAAVQTTNIASDVALKEATKKCGLTTEEAIEQAAIQSYTEDSAARWFTGVAPYESIWVSKALKVEISEPEYSKCKVAKVETEFSDKEDDRRPNYSIISYYQMCRNNDGEIVVVDKLFHEQEYSNLMSHDGI